MIEDALLTPGQVAERLQLQERTVTRWLPSASQDYRRQCLLIGN